MKRLAIIIIIILTNKQLDSFSGNLIGCKTYTFNDENFNETKLDLVVVRFLRSVNSDSIRSYHSHSYQLKYFNLNYVVYHYPQHQCKTNTIHLFLDVLLNETLFKRRPFKIIAILTDTNNSELTDLANIMSPYSVPVIPITPSKDTHVHHMKKLHRYYDNVLLILPEVILERQIFLKYLISKLNIRLITILHNFDETHDVEEIFLITEYLKKYSTVCLNIHNIKLQTFQKDLDIILEKEHSNVYVFAFKEYAFSLRLINYFNKHVSQDTVIVFYNQNSSKIEKRDNAVLNIKNNKLHILLMKDTHINRSPINLNVPLRLSIDYIRQPLIYMIKQAPAERTYPLKYRFIFNIFLLKLESYYFMSFAGNVQKNNIKVYYFETQNGSRNYSEIYSNHGNHFQGRYGWTCWECANLPKLHPVCSKRNCSPGYYPVYLSSGCCWNCLPCYPGYIKPTEGQTSCFKCQYDSIANINKTQCLPFIYKYFRITYSQRIVAAVLSILGCIYTTFTFAVFLYYKNTPIVKSSNFMLSIFQISLHAILSVHLAITILEQKQYICYMHSFCVGYILKIIMSIYIIKTNQLLAIFQSSTKIKKNVCLTFKQAAFPATYIAIKMFIIVILLTVYKKLEYGIYEVRYSLVKFKYCDIGAYFYIDFVFTVILSILCSVQAFMVRKLPANYNEAYYIFLGTFATTNLLTLSIPLNASFNTDGQKIFVHSIVIYSANMSLISIAYGYKIHIMLFQRHRNTKEAFQKIMQQAMQDNFKKLKKRPRNG